MNGEYKPRPQALVAEKDALSVYFDALLSEEPEPQPAELAVRAVPPPAPPVTSVPVTSPTVAVVPPLAQPSVAPPLPPVQDDAIPHWGEQRFQAMLFKAAGLTLAVPLAELHGVQEWDAEQLTPMPGHVDWYLGLVPYRGRSVPVVDTARLVLPPDRLSRLTLPAGERIHRIVFIDGGRWGLACDVVDEVLTLSAEQVRWRTQRTVRRWLAGTVIQHMCALIDPAAFARMLATGLEAPGAKSPATGKGPLTGANAPFK